MISSDDADGTYVKLMGFGEKMSMIKLAERVTIYKEDNTKAKLPYEKAYTYLDNYISNATGIYNGFSVLIRYKTDVDGNVGTIELPLGTDADLSKADDDRLCVIVNGAETGLKYQSSGHFMGQCAVDSATIGMQLAKDDIENIIKKKADLVNNGTYNLVAYTTRPGSLMAQYMLMTVGNSDVKEFKDTYFVVEDVYSVYDEDYGEVSELKGWYVSYYDRREETIRINDSQLIKNAVDFAGNKYKVSAGDVIYISMNSKKDAANGIYMIYDADGKNGAGTGLMGDEKGILAGAVQSYHTGGNPYGNPYSFNVSTTQVISPVAGDYMNNNRIFLGYVKEANDSAITVTTQQLGKNSEYNMNYDKSKYYTEILPGLNSKIIKLDMTGKKTTVSQGSLSDLKSFDDFSGGCSKVLLLQREWVTIGVIVIEE